MLKRFLCVIILIVVGCGSSKAQRNNTSAELSENRKALLRADEFTESTIRQRIPGFFKFSPDPGWIRESNYVFFMSPEQDNIRTFYVFDAISGKTERLFDAREYGLMISPFIGKTPESERPDFQMIRKLQGKQKVFLCRAEGRELLFDLKNKRFSDLPDSESSKPHFPAIKEYWKRFTKDSLFSIHVYNGNLYLSGSGLNAPDSLVRLTHDAEEYYSFATRRPSPADKGLQPWSGQWFADSHIGYTLRKDTRKVTSLGLLNHLSKPIPKVTEYKFELPGDKDVTQYELWLIYADSSKAVRADIEKFQDQEVKLVYSYNYDVPDGIYFTRRNRVGDTLELCRLNPFTGKVVTLITEASKPIVNELMHNCTLVNGGKEIIWWSERTGKGAFYLYDNKGKLKNPITTQDFVAGQLFYMDATRRYMIIEGYGLNKEGNPYYKKFYKVNFNGSGFTELTPAEGEHSIELSSDKKYILDRYSTVSEMPKCEVRNTKGKLIKTISMPGDSLLIAYGWSRPVLEKVKAADHKTDLFGIIYTPSDLNPMKKYPVICAVYPGPQTDMIPRTFETDPGHNNSLAQMGFIVIQFGYRGSSPLRGRDFYTFGYGNLRDYALEDCKYVVEQLAEKYSWFDTERVGIYGHSGGGFLSAAAILTYPEFFKVAVSASGNHDNNIYGKFWTETYHGLTAVPVTYPDGSSGSEWRSEVPTTIDLADRLQGRLLLITGDMDNNVHPAATFKLVNALIRNNKRFDLMVFPGRDHMVEGDYYYNLIRYYFEEHLKNPKEFDCDMQ